MQMDSLFDQSETSSKEPSVLLTNSAKELDDYCNKLETDGCTRCELSQNARVVVSRGNIRSTLMVVGQNPGDQEDQNGIPFCGPAGKLLDVWIEESGLSKFKPYFTNVGLCKTPDNSPLNSEQREACSIHLNTQIKLLAPKAIIAVGKPAINALVPITEAMQTADIILKRKLYKHPDIDFYVSCFFIYHPAFLLRKQGEEGKPYKEKNMKVLNMVKLFLEIDQAEEIF
jgi:uracil-DNA glycosylase family 4